MVNFCLTTFLGSNPGEILKKILIFFPSQLKTLVRIKKCGTLHDFACHPCAGAMLIFSVSFQF